MDGEALIGPSPCELCYDELMSVKHILLNCRALRDVRRRIMSACRGNINATMRDVLGEDANVRETLEYIRAVNLYNQI